MKKLLASIIITLVSIISASAQGIICVQGDTTAPIFVTDLSDAISKAKAGDHIYLPGGSTFTNNVTINKKLFIIGAGYDPSSTKAAGATYITGDWLLDTGARESYISGIDGKGIIIYIKASNVTVTRCLLGGIGLQDNPSNISISENIIQSNRIGYSLHGNNISNPILVFNNVLLGQIALFRNGVFVNNVFSQSNGNYLINQCQYVRFENNIFFHSNPSLTLVGVGNNHFRNNLFLIDSTTVVGGASSMSSNIFKQSSDSIFKTYDWQLIWNQNYNFHLQQNCKGIKAGTDSTDVGIYGSSNPFKSGGIPINPHFQEIHIPTGTTPDGKLNVKIKVQGQGR